MRSFFGLPQDVLLWSVTLVACGVTAALGLAAWRNPVLARLAWRNIPRRPGFAALITVGLTIGTIILSSAFTTGDTMAHSVRAVVAGVLGSADEVVFVPAPVQRSGFDLAQSIATGSLLTGVTDYFPESQVDEVRTVVGTDPRVAAIVPIVLEQAPAASDGQTFAAQLNLLGVPAASPYSLETTAGATVQVADLADDEVFLNTEAASGLNVAAGQQVHIYNLPTAADVVFTVRGVTRLGDLGGGQATVFFPLHRLQTLLDRPRQVNQVLIVNRGDAATRLASSWPLTVQLRAAFVDEQAVARAARAMSSPPARDLLARAIAAPDTSGRLADKLRRLQGILDQPDPARAPEFRALAADPEVLSRLAGRLGGAVQRGNTPFAAGLAGVGSFRVLDVQSIAQDQADRWGSAFTDLFVVLGAFSLFSGMLLIVLIFSLVALERRTELGITRALGAQRRDVVLLLALEGGLYSVISALFGLGGGLLLALAIIGLARGLVEQYGFTLTPVIDPASLAASFGLGVLLTFLAVTATAWRASRFSIVTAIRDLPEPPAAAPGARALAFALVPAVTGPLLIRAAIDSRLSLVYAAGVGLAIVGVALTARWILLRLGWRGPERVVFTLAGVALIGWWMLPLALFPTVVEMSFLSGVMMLLGAVWVIAYNIGLLRRVRAPAALWRLSTAYVAANRFRTGLTLTMFALVVLSLTVSAVMLTATRDAYADPGAVTGGWDIRAASSLPLRDLATDLTASGVIGPTAFTAVGGTALYPAEGIQTGPATGGPAARWAPATVLGVDAGFIAAAAEPAWAQLDTPGTAIVGEGLLQASPSRLRIDSARGAPPAGRVLWLRDTRGTRPAVRVQVVGFADARGPFGTSIITSAATLDDWPRPEAATYFLRVPPAANARELAAGLNLAAPDLQANTIGDELRLVQGVRGLLNMILQGFMGVGLLAGIAALGTLSTRAVVERRRQIGVLRALGFTARAVSAGLLVEAAVVSVLGAGLGVGIGLFVAQSTVVFLGRVSPELRFSIPWAQLGLVVLVACGAALLMTVLPARQAARLTPAEALRDG